MTTQTDLFREPVFPPGPLTRKEEIDRAFRQFHMDNPEVWRLFCRFTFQLINKGFKHYSARAVIHRLRWHTAVETTDSQYKINNNYTPGYARLFHATYPEHKGFFRNRECVSGRSLPRER